MKSLPYLLILSPVILAYEIASRVSDAFVAFRRTSRLARAA